MGRNIISAAPAGAAQPAGIPAREIIPGAAPAAQAATPDNYANQIVKLIPADIVGVYLGVQNLFVGLDSQAKFLAQSIIFLVILAISPLYLKKVAGITDRNQRMVSVLSYIIWGISLGGPFAYLLAKVTTQVSAETIGSALLMLYTLVVPLLYKPSKS